MAMVSVGFVTIFLGAIVGRIGCFYRRVLIVFNAGAMVGLLEFYKVSGFFEILFLGVLGSIQRVSVGLIIFFFFPLASNGKHKNNTNTHTHTHTHECIQISGRFLQDFNFEVEPAKAGRKAGEKPGERPGEKPGERPGEKPGEGGAKAGRGWIGGWSGLKRSVDI